jgi:mevalonate kinase
MNWLIPAKTFLLGEYAAVAEASAILLSTTPFFKLTLTENEGLHGIHPESPAGLWWQQQNIKSHGLSWHDPYAGQGGLGASSAQFLGSYLASSLLQEKAPCLNGMLEAYYQFAWTGKGLRPSGYDVIAQSQSGCVYINKQRQTMHVYPWPFQDLSFFLIHTGIKLATHHHLQETSLPAPINDLSALVDDAQQAFVLHDSQRLLNTINQYHEQLASLNLVAEHSRILIQQFQEYPEVRAIKGCGALGSDILLIVCMKKEAAVLEQKLKTEKQKILATEKSLSQHPPLLSVVQYTQNEMETF